MKVHFKVLDGLLTVAVLATLTSFCFLTTLRTHATWTLALGLVFGVTACILLVAIRPYGDPVRVFIGRCWNALDTHAEPDVGLNRIVAVGVWVFFGCFLGYKAYSNEMGVLVTTLCAVGSGACFLGALGEARR